MDDTLLTQLQNNTLDDSEKERRIGDDDSDISDDDDLADHQQPSPLTNISMMRQGGRQTGPKGVIDDQKYQQQMDASKNHSQQMEHNAKLLARAPMTTTYLQDQQQQQQMELVLDSKALRLQQHDGEEEEDSDDEEMLKAYRTKRLAELKQLRNHRTRQEHRVFGTVQDVDADDYATAIDNEWRTVPVIVHLYDDRLERCRHLDLILEGLARKYRLAKVIRVSALDLAFDLVGSPAILGYKSGMLIANLVRLDDELIVGGAKYYTAEAVEDVLVRYDVLSDEDQYDIPRIDDVDVDDD